MFAIDLGTLASCHTTQERSDTGREAAVQRTESANRSDWVHQHTAKRIAQVVLSATKINAPDSERCN